jgi:hypothetical protein
VNDKSSGECRERVFARAGQRQNDQRPGSRTCTAVATTGHQDSRFQQKSTENYTLFFDTNSLGATVCQMTYILNISGISTNVLHGVQCITCVSATTAPTEPHHQPTENQALKSTGTSPDTPTHWTRLSTLMQSCCATAPPSPMFDIATICSWPLAFAPDSHRSV